tara:strand:+ start:2925 stop:3872 length:948 start_codon:yes stop_codon:yes gene_type:complete
MDKVVVTGGMGFIGRNLVELLHYNDYEVHVIDNFSTEQVPHYNFEYKVVNRPRPKIKEYGPNPVKVYDLDIQSSKNVASILDGAKYVFHLAAWPRVEPSIKDPLQFHTVNTTNSLKLFWECVQAGVEKVIFSSSSSVYGNPEEVPTKEDHNFDPMSPYALNKAHGEDYLEILSRLYGLNSVSLRYFNVYGESQPVVGAYVPVMGIFFSQKEKNKPLTVTGDGMTKRDFVNVKDVARANLQAALADLPKGHNAFNIGCGVNYTILDIARSISSNIAFTEARFEPKETLANIDKAKELLSWEPQFELMDWIEDNKPR